MYKISYYQRGRPDANIAVAKGKVWTWFYFDNANFYPSKFLRERTKKY
jgi:hypothetical protein